MVSEPFLCSPGTLRHSSGNYSYSFCQLIVSSTTLLVVNDRIGMWSTTAADGAMFVRSDDCWFIDHEGLDA